MEVNAVKDSSTAPAKNKGANGDALSVTGHTLEDRRRYFFVLIVVMTLLTLLATVLSQSSFRGSPSLHTSMETVGVMLGLVIGFVMAMNFYTMGKHFYLFIGLAFLVNATVDAVHGFLSFESLHGLASIPLSTVSALEKTIPGTSVMGRLMFGLLLLAAPFAGLKNGKAAQRKSKTSRVFLGTVIITAAVTAAAFKIPFPPFVYPDFFIPRPAVLLSAFLPAAALVLFLREYRDSRDMLTWWFALAIGINSLGQFMMSFSREFFDIFFHIGGLYKVLGCAVPLAGFSIAWASGFSQRMKLEKTNQELQKKIAELHQAEEKIQFVMNQRKQVEEQRRFLVEDLERTNRELEEFAYVVSHDLKAPLRGINSLTRWLTEDYLEVLDQEGREILDKLQVRTKRMHNFIEGVLRYSRIGRLKLTPQLLESEAVVQEIIDGISPPETIPVKIKDTLPAIVYDKMLLTQLFQNLISNAISHLGKPEGEVVISGIDRGNAWEFCVKDNGIGIEERHFERIFKIFQCLKTRSEQESTGIGLSLVKKITERTGGDVWVESTVGEGSAFYFTVPKTSQTESPISGLTVLIIDDNRDFIDVATAMFEREKLKVLGALSGQEAYEILELYKKEIQIILMDIHIPGEDTVERFKKIKELQPQIKIIACSGANLPDINELLKKKGLMDGMLTKPFKISDLKRVIGRIRIRIPIPVPVPVTGTEDK
jgi:signal transduction histidine kinase